jgi:hypothetical protein
MQMLKLLQQLLDVSYDFVWSFFCGLLLLKVQGENKIILTIFSHIK